MRIAQLPSDGQFRRKKGDLLGHYGRKYVQGNRFLSIALVNGQYPRGKRVMNFIAITYISPQSWTELANWLEWHAEGLGTH